MAINGTEILLLVNTGTPALPVYEAVGSQRDATFGETTDAIDVSSKDGRAKRVLPGRYTAEVTAEALYVYSDAAYQALKDAMRDGTMIKILRQEEGVSLEWANAVVTDLSQAAPDQDGATVSIGLAIDGEWEELVS
jgi:TP901-1 family phage major tail protein